MIAKLAETGNFKHVQAVCDVSGSMGGEPMEVAIALGLVVAALTEEPFKGKLITFHEQPSIHTISGTTLRDRVRDVQGMSWGGSTDLLAVFKLLLTEAQATPGAQMVEKLFIFSDMQFNVADRSGRWETTYDAICKMYGKTQFAVPKIIFWNLRATHKSFPVQKDELGTALISGFSAQMMKAFLANDTVNFSPLTIMNEALDKYQFTEIPKEERCPIDPLRAGWGSFDAAAASVQRVVEEHLVAKKVPKKKKKAAGGSATYSSEDDSDTEH